MSSRVLWLVGAVGFLIAAPMFGNTSAWVFVGAFCLFLACVCFAGFLSTFESWQHHVHMSERTRARVREEQRAISAVLDKEWHKQHDEPVPDRPDVWRSGY